MKLNLVLIVNFFLAFVTLTASADLTTIAKIGEPAAGFPPEFVYWNLNGSPVIGNGGHIAFSGAADISINSTEKNQEAVWAGKPGQLHPVIKEDESPKGFLASTVFSRAHPKSLVVSDSGSVAFAASMKGSSNGSAYLASINGTTFGIIKIGDPAPGFPAGTSVLVLYNFVFTDAGMAIFGATNTGQTAIWFWRNNKLELVLASNNEFTGLYPGCTVGLLSLGDLNQAGEMIFSVDLLNNSDANCPISGLFTWNDGVFKKIVIDKDPVQGFPSGTSFRTFTTTFLLAGSRINNNGDVSFLATFSDGQVSGSGMWVAYNNGKIDPIALSGELLPGLAGKIFPSFFGVSLNANLLTVSKVSSLEKGEVILVGSPKQGANYSDLGNLGESHLKTLAHRESQPSGFSDTWFFNKFGQPLINNQDTIAFWAEIRDALDPNRSSTRGIWLGDNNGDLELLVAEGLPIKIDGENKTLSSISDISQALSPSSTNSGLPNQLNDDDELVFIGTPEGSKSTIFYSGSSKVESNVTSDCTASYRSNGLLNIPCVTVPNASGGTSMYQAEMKLIPLSNPLSFELTNAQQKVDESIVNTCVSVFNTDGLLTIPCVTVPDNSGNTSTYQAEMKLVPQSTPFAFKLIQAKQL